jgi:hypothetical protein
MRRIAEMDEKIKELRKLMKEAKTAEEEFYYEGVITALTWVKDKSNEETYIYFK